MALSNRFPILVLVRFCVCFFSVNVESVWKHKLSYFLSVNSSSRFTLKVNPEKKFMLVTGRDYFVNNVHNWSIKLRIKYQKVFISNHSEICMHCRRGRNIAAFLAQRLVHVNLD